MHHSGMVEKHTSLSLFCGEWEMEVIGASGDLSSQSSLSAEGSGRTSAFLSLSLKPLCMLTGRLEKTL